MTALLAAGASANHSASTVKFRLWTMLEVLSLFTALEKNWSVPDVFKIVFCMRLTVEITICFALGVLNLTRRVEILGNVISLKNTVYETEKTVRLEGSGHEKSNIGHYI